MYVYMFCSIRRNAFVSTFSTHEKTLCVCVCVFLTPTCSLAPLSHFLALSLPLRLSVCLSLSLLSQNLKKLSAS